MKSVFTLALILVMGGFLHADITLPDEAQVCGTCTGTGFGLLTPVAGKTRRGVIGSTSNPTELQQYDLSSWVYADENGFLVFLWQITNNTATTIASGVTQNANNWFGDAFLPYDTGVYGNAEQGVDGTMIGDLNGDYAGLAQAGGVDPNHPLDLGRTWNNVLYVANESPTPGHGYIKSLFGGQGPFGTFGDPIDAGQHSTIWWVHTNARNYVSGNCGDPYTVGCLSVNFGVDGVSTLGGVVNIESYMPTSAVPEPATLFLMGSGFVGLAGAMRKKLRRS